MTRYTTVDFYGRSYFVSGPAKLALDTLEAAGRASDDAVRGILVSERQHIQRENEP